MDFSYIILISGSFRQEMPLSKEEINELECLFLQRKRHYQETKTFILSADTLC
jgi:shikimate kinase